MAKIQTLKINGEVVYPRTIKQAIVDLQGTPTIITNDGSGGDSVAITLTENGSYQRTFRIDMTAEYTGGANEQRIGSLIIECYSDATDDICHGYYYGDDMSDILTEVAVYQDDTDTDTFYLMLRHNSDNDSITYAITPLDDGDVEAIITNAADDHTKSDDANITEIEKTSNKVSTLSGNETNTTYYPNTKAVADALGKMGIISQTQTWSGSGSNPRTYVMSDQVYGLIPQSFIDLVSASGVSFNDSGADKSVTDYFGNSVTHKAGCFLVGSIGDISYDEMRVIYNKTVGAIPIAGGSRNYLFASEADARATMPLHTTSSFGVTCQYMLYVSNIEELVFDSPLSSLYCSSNSHITSAFNGANRLRRISGAVLKWNMVTAVTDPFKNCYSLESVKLYNIKTSFSFAQSPNLDLASVVYAVENAANGTSAITLTMHSTAYARCQADTTEYTYGGQTYTGIIALATAKNITIASA